VAFKDERWQGLRLLTSNDNPAASALPLIALPGISSRIETGRKGWLAAFAKQKRRRRSAAFYFSAL